MGIKISVKNGEALIDVEGMEGPGCKNVLEASLKAAQLQVIKDDPKPEFYAQASAEATESEVS